MINITPQNTRSCYSVKAVKSVAPEIEDFVVACEKLEFSYVPGVNILNELSFRLPQESIGVIFGRSGIGKTTLLRCLSGYLQPTRGSIRWGVDSPPRRNSFSDINQNSDKAQQLLSLWGEIDKQKSLAKQGIRQTSLYRQQQPAMMVFADCSNALAHLTAEENLELVLSPVCPTKETRTQAISLLLEITALSEVRNQIPAQLSSGQLRRLCLAQSLAVNPRLLVWDEPTSGLDAGTKYDLLNFLQILRLAVPFPILIVTHDIETALLLANNIFLFDNGQIKHTLRIDIPPQRYPHDLDLKQFVPLRQTMLEFLNANKIFSGN
jgi:molybdate transport system ATP-binding protein